jgi:hypothetical protein
VPTPWTARAGNDTFRIAGLEASGDSFIGGDDIGGADTDTIFVTGPLTLTSFGVAGKNYSTVFTGGPTAAGATYTGVEVFDANNQTISGVNNGSDILDFSGFSITRNLGTINTADATGGTDYVNVSTATAGVTINGGGGKQIIIGSAFNDTIDGKSGNDNIDGGAGDDLITGGTGNDTLTGSAGNDTFRFGSGHVGADVITDYSVTLTTLDFEDISTSTETGPIGSYKGFSWSNTGVVNASGSYVGPGNSNPNLNGYKAQSGTQIAFIGSANNFQAPGYPTPPGQPIVIDSLTGDFHFVSAYFSAAARDGLTITAEAYDDGVLVGNKTFTVNKGTPTSGPTLISFTEGLGSELGSAERFWGIDQLKFISNDNNPDTNDYFGFDDFTYGVGDVIDLADGMTRSLSPGSGDTLITLGGSGSGTVTLDNYTGPVLFV